MEKETMKWSITLGRILGINIKVHLTFFLILVWGALNYGGSAGPLYGLIVTLALFALVLLHELGHSLAAMRYGISVRDITLLPIGGVARLEQMPEKPVQELVVALAGPAVNIVLALVSLPLVLGLGDPLSLGLTPRAGVFGLLTFLFSANLYLAAFNLLPAFPMDGGRVFRALLGLFLDFQRSTAVAVRVGRVLAVGLGMFGFFTGQFFLAIIALFIFTASGQEGDAVAARSLLRQVRVEQAWSRNTASLSPYATVGQLASMAMTDYRPDFAVLDPHTRQLLGVVHRDDVARAMQRGQWQRPVSEIMGPVQSVPSVTLSSTLAEVQDKLAAASSRIAAVYDGPFFQGLISLYDVQRAFQFLSRSGQLGQRLGWETPG
jgi:Zn-dependent protease